jgi:hypothetical protein
MNVANIMRYSFPSEERIYTCTSNHIAAIVSGHRVREMDINIPGEHAEMAVIRKYSNPRLRYRRPGAGQKRYREKATKPGLR